MLNLDSPLITGDAQREHDRHFRKTLYSSSTRQPSVLKGLLPGFQDRRVQMERDPIPALKLTRYLNSDRLVHYYVKNKMARDM